MTIAEFKKHFSQSADHVHFNNAGQALIPDLYRDRAIYWLNRFYDEGANCAMEAWHLTDVTRKTFAQFIGADESEVSFFQTTASALSQAAASIPLGKDDEILTWDQEYPSNFYPWRRAAETSQARLIQIASENWQTPYQKILDRVTPKTKVVAISWVQYQTGSVTDMQALASALRGSGIWLVADIIQGAGVRPFHFHQSGFDIVCGGSHKWLCSSYGVGYMVARKDRIQELSPMTVGAMTYGNPDTPKSFSIQPKTDSQKFEPGTKSVIELIAMNETLQLFLQTGVENIFAEACRLANLLRHELSAKSCLNHSEEGPLVNFSLPPGKPMKEFVDLLHARRVSFAERGPGLRFSLHAYNRESEIERFLGFF